MYFEYNLFFLSIIIAFIVSTVFIILSYFLILRNTTIEKNSTYECGFQPFSDSRVPFDIHFYLVGLLFLLFDLEILFLVPWIFVIDLMQFINYIVLFIFLIILTIGFIYEWKKGALDW